MLNQSIEKEWVRFHCVCVKVKENKKRTEEEEKKKRWNEAINDLQLCSGYITERKTWKLMLHNDKLFTPVN